LLVAARVNHIPTARHFMPAALSRAHSIELPSTPKEKHMDIGTKRDPGRELGKAEVDKVSGGDRLPEDLPEEFPGEPGCMPAGGPIVDGG